MALPCAAGFRRILDTDVYTAFGECPVNGAATGLSSSLPGLSPSAGARDRARADDPLFHLPVAVLRLNRVGRVTYANDRASELTGRPAAELLDQRPPDLGLMPPPGRTWAGAVAEVLRTGHPCRFEIRTGRNGAEWWFDATLAGEPGGASDGGTALLVAFDITPYRDTATRLRALEIRLRRLTEGSQDLISEHAPDGRFLYASPAAVPLLGVEPALLLGRPLVDLVEPEDRPRIEAALRASRPGERPRPVAFRTTHPDGKLVWCELTAHAAGAEDRNAPALICITRDITERARSEEALRLASRMESTTTLAAGVAHDFNNLMTGILGNAELLLSDPTFPDASSRLEQIATAATRGGGLAQQLLAFARGGKYRTAPICLNEVVRQALDLQKPATPPRIQLEEDLAPRLPTVLGDPVQLGQVVTNLCLNATEAISGMGRVTVRTRHLVLNRASASQLPGLRPGDHVMLAVHDTGAGIDPAVQARIFEPFFSTKFQGRGLGLAAAYGIVTNHLGHIAVESEPGRGTTVTIYLPASTTSAGTALAGTAPVPRLPYPTGDETILLVDDDDAVVSVTRAILERLHYRVLVARNGIEALDLAQGHPGPIDLALLDLGLPMAGGAEVLPGLMAARPGLRVVIATGYECTDTVEQLLRSGAHAFLQKPYRVGGLAATVRRVLDGEAAPPTHAG